MTSRPRCDSRRKRRSRDTRARDRSALRATQPGAGLVIPHGPRRARFQTSSRELRVCSARPPPAWTFVFSRSPGGVSGLSSAESRDSWAPYMAVATAAQARGLGRAGGPTVLARGSGARKCTQTINFPPASPPGAARRPGSARGRRLPPRAWLPTWAGQAAWRQSVTSTRSSPWPGASRQSSIRTRVTACRRLPTSAWEAGVQGGSAVREQGKEEEKISKPWAFFLSFRIPSFLIQNKF